jgi:hypothetical protein
LQHKAPKNTAALSQLGNLYQYLIALKVCLESPQGEVINIEAYGDLTTTDFNFEIKHHINPHYTLNETHIDFWKSLSNWVNNRRFLKNHNRFILLTTAIVKADGIFGDWNMSSVNKKYKKISSIKQKVVESKHDYKTISPFVTNVFAFDAEYKEKDLLDVLDKLVLKHSCQNAEYFYDELKDHQGFLTVRESHRKSLIRSLIGFILEKGILEPRSWDIEINEFISFLREQARKLANGEVPEFPDLTTTNSFDEEVLKMNFIKKIEEIPYPEKVSLAAINYTRTQKVIMLMADQNPHVLKEFENNADDAGRQLKHMKSIACLEMNRSDFNQLTKKSKILFHKADLGVKTGERPPDIQSGIIHIHVDESDFVWKIKEEDIED